MNAEHRDTTETPDRLLVTKTVRLKMEERNVRYAELGSPANPPVWLITIRLRARVTTVMSRFMLSSVDGFLIHTQ